MYLRSMLSKTRRFIDSKIHRLFLVKSMHCQPPSMNHRPNLHAVGCDSLETIYLLFEQFLSFVIALDLQSPHHLSKFLVEYPHAPQRAEFAKKVHKPPLVVNVINFELNWFNASIWVPCNPSDPKKL